MDTALHGLTSFWASFSPTLKLKALLAVGAMLLLPVGSSAQQVSDDEFQFRNDEPAFEMGLGPHVCIDEAHFNFHTVDGRYKAFAELLRRDGYVVDGFDQPFTTQSLAACDLLVVANALSELNQSNWNYPHPSAFSGPEIRATMQWVRAGGRFLLFADHAPLSGAARDLAAVFGVMMIDVYVDGGPGPDQFRTGDQTLLDHQILQGRSRAEQIDSVMTFTGQPLQITEGWSPLLVYGPLAMAKINLQQSFQQGNPPAWPAFSVAGWVHGAVREWDAGRVVFLGEAAMCSAQVSGPTRSAMGMNDPLAAQNPQFCLNVVRWLTGVLEG